MSGIRATVQSPTGVGFSDGEEVNLIAGKQAEQLVSALHTELYTQTYRGAVFHASTTPLGLAIPIYTSATPLVCLWNPLGSGKNLSLQHIYIAYASGTAVYGAIGLMYEINTGGVVATGAPFSAFSSATPVNGFIGGGCISVGKVSISGTNTLTTAGTAARWMTTLGSMNLEAATGTAHGVTDSHFGLDGSIIVAPGSAVWVASTLASVALFAQTICWAETPV